MLDILLKQNFILMCDGYKANHWQEIPEDNSFVYEVCVPRKASKYSDEIVAMGQSLLAEFFSKVTITKEMIDEAEYEIVRQGYSFNRHGWERIVKENNGKLPIILMGVEEGRVVKAQTPIIAWMNTLPKMGWLSGVIETVNQSVMWKMSTVASVSRACRKVLYTAALNTGTKDSIDYKLHNFGDRSADGPEAAVYAAISHAALFNGSDCLQTNAYIKNIYKEDGIFTSSIEATEHFSMTMNSDTENQDDFGAAKMAVDRLKACVERSKNGYALPMMSVVIDTYDDVRFVNDYMGTELKDEIINSGGRMIMRPDSGDPLTKPAEIANILVYKFGATFNEKNYCVLHPSVGVIQGDGLTVETLPDIVNHWVLAGYSLDNFALGMGSGISHDGRRDDFSFSVKAIAKYNESDKCWKPLLKNPKTDSGKKSLSGLVRCYENEEGELYVKDVIDNFGKLFEETNGWKIWYSNGERYYYQSFSKVREFARKNLIIE